MKMKEIVTIILLASLIVLPSVSALPKNDFNTLTEGEIMYSSGHYLAGQPIPTGFDDYGYNYQGHLFKDSNFNVYSGGAGFPPYVGDDESYLDENPGAASHWAWPYRSIKLVMKWNDSGLSNVDRDDD